MSQLLLTVFLGPVGRFHGFEFAVHLGPTRVGTELRVSQVSRISFLLGIWIGIRAPT